MVLATKQSTDRRLSGIHLRLGVTNSAVVQMRMGNVGLAGAQRNEPFHEFGITG
jgi:hypothetical protein